MLNLAFMASHNGSGAMAIVTAIKEGRLVANPVALISNNRDSVALERAKEHGIPAYHLSSTTHPEPADLDQAIRDVLTKSKTDLVVLSGYMKKLGPKTLETFHNRIINIHPSLLPKYGGRGMYGAHVHKAVLENKETVTGITVHLTDDKYDHGRILAQCEVPVLPGDSSETLAARVQAREKTFYVEVLQAISSGEIKISKRLT